MPVDSEADTGEIPLPKLRKASAPVAASAGAGVVGEKAAVPRTPVVGGGAAKAPAGPVVTGPVAPAAVPPKPVSPPEPVTGTGTGTAGDVEGEPGTPADETRIIPKIIIVDDGADYATPNTVSYRRR